MLDVCIVDLPQGGRVMDEKKNNNHVFGVGHDLTSKTPHLHTDYESNAPTVLTLPVYWVVCI